MTNGQYNTETGLELKGGLDQFTDDRRDNDIIFNSKHSWEEKLKVSGFNVKFILPSDEDTIAENGQTIFFCTKGDNAFNITENYIKTFLKERLPEYMIPRNIRFMENIPLNVNNKIDRRLLLTMSQSIRETKMTLTNLEEKENLNQNEKIISSIWKEILGIEYVNKKDNFYSVGGDSLLIAQVVTKMRKSIKQLENISWDQLMREVLENPTLEGMSNIISQKEHSIQKMQKTSMSKYIHKYNETENAPVKVISFFHAGTGRLIDYKHMVENLLDKDMSDTQLIGFTYGEYQQYMETPVESLVQDRANLYAETLLEFNVDRYTLVGYCVGGFLALETAKILLENGKKVKLIMIDSRLCQHTISNQLLMEYAYGLSMELDMDNTPYSIKPVMLKEALEKILNGENRNIKNSELTKLSGAMWNYRKSRKINPSRKRYGKKVKVGDKYMRVSIMGKSSKVLLILPGWNSISPILEFKPLAEKLSEYFTVITIEPLGYGLSDRTERLRGTCNIVEELHRCVENLGYCKYYILAHSISGLYCLEWCRQYEKEVEGFIGIDISVPGMEETNLCPIKTSIICKILLYKNWIFNIIGINRLLFFINPYKIIHLDKKYQYSMEERDILETLCLNGSINKTMLAEINQLNNNLLYVEMKKFPESIPVYQFLSSANCKIISTWKELHIKILVTDNPIIILEGSHYLHLEQKDSIVNHIIKWIRDLDEGKRNCSK